MVMPRSRSRSFESMTRSSMCSWAAKVPDCCSSLATRVVLPWSTWAMMATLRRFMALLLVVQWLERDLAGKPGPTFPDRAQNLKCERGNGLDLWPQKGSPAKRPGNTLCVAAQYIQKTPKNNDLFGIWLVDFRATARLIALFGVRIDP